VTEKTFHAYPDIRKEIQQGDIVAFYGGKAWSDRLYSLCLRLSGMGQHTHIAIVRRETFLETDRVWVIETEPGVGGHVQPLSRYDGRRFDVFSCPVEGDQTVDQAMVMLDRIRSYNWGQVFELMRMGFVRRFSYWIKGRFTNKLPPLTDKDDALVCSSFVTQVLSKEGWGERKPGLWPSAVAEQMGSPRLQYRPGKPSIC
jgi:hypothetical protein